MFCKKKAAERFLPPGGLFVLIAKEDRMAISTQMVLVSIVFYGLIFAAIVAVIIRAVKYLIRYGIDYYFKKLDEREQKTGGKTL